MAWIRRRGDRWSVRYRNGEGRERSLGSFRRKLDADRARRDFERSMERSAGFDPHAGSVTVAEWSGTWIATKYNVKPKTLEGYRSLLRSRVLPRFGTTPINRLAPGDVDGWVASMVAEDLSPSRIRQAHQLLGAMMKAAIRRDLIASNPCAGTPLPTLVVREQRFLTAGELAGVASAMPDYLEASVWTLGVAGLRFGELAALEPGDVDVLHRTINVAKSAAEVRGRLTVGTPKNGKTRTVTIPKTLAEIVNDHLTTTPGDLAFPSAKGVMLRAVVLRRNLHAACAAVGVEAIRVHDLRHTAAALMLAAEPDLYLTMRQLGHSSISVTADRYGHLLPGRAEAAADKLDALLRSSIGDRENVRSLPS